MADTFQPQSAGDERANTIGLWTRRAVLALFGVVVLLALLNVFGQRPTDSEATTGGARLSLSAPKTVRGGILFQSRIEVRALRTIDHARLVLREGWFEGMQISNIEPQPTSEESQDGRVVLSYGRLRAGDRLVVWVQSQVDPTNPGRRDYGVELQDAVTPVARIDRRITVLP
ncbi:hypothetical protein [Capillimicrobium parvum]|uniref:Uncharacterized protein n=1 Tax=Capillimicrobium parvum TaxID=2884022 RepID=A0A9E7C7B5_9ACTN|nr:hypothetical protein [Capillimicrobium parvum]UGS39238.1 hypothetical protein DSM104329_05671 [Capillimicrobium parvum]